MLLVIGTFRIPPEKLVAARGAVEAMILASRDEPGCIEYSYAQDTIDPGLMRVTESWRDQPSLDAHAASDHLKTWRATWSALNIHDRDLRLYQVDDVGRTI